MLSDSFPDSSSTIDRRSSDQPRFWHRLMLAGVLSLAAFLNFYKLQQEGYANLYYAAAVKSMLTSWHNFFFISFDPAGFVTVDKPPLGLWIQAISAWLLGFEGWALLLPQVVAGVLSVLVLYHLVGRVFGPTAGLLAALILVLTPISVAANRNNTMDSLLVLALLLATWALFLALERGKLSWLLLSFTLVGLGFNIKMLQAFLVLPAFYLLYLIGSPSAWWKRFIHLGVATAVLLIVSFSWATIVDMTPPAERPYVGSSQDNTVMELIIGHNGLSRLLPARLQRQLTGDDGPPRPPDDRPPGQLPPRPPANQPGKRPLPPPSLSQSQPQPPPKPSQGGPGSGAPFGYETGDPGPLRLFNQQLAGQIAWLLPLAGISIILGAWGIQLAWPLARRHQALLFWTAWLLPMALFFSMANLFHRYYLTMMAPAVAALAAVGLTLLWKAYRNKGWSGWLLPVVLVGTALFQAVVILSSYPDWSRWLSPLVVGLGLVTAVGLVIFRETEIRDFVVSAQSNDWKLEIGTGIVVVCGLAAILLAPAVWAYTPVLFGGDTGLPYAGPDLAQKPPALVDAEIPGLNPDLTAFLLEQQDGQRFLAATMNARTAAPIILSTGEAVMAMGGFSGSDRILSLADLADMVAAGEVRFFLLTEREQDNELGRLVDRYCRRLPVSGERDTAIPNPPGERPLLFDCLRLPDA